MLRLILIIIVIGIPQANIFGQNERKLVREGVREYNDQKYTDAEVQFRKAKDLKPELYEADYNIANTLYKQKKYKEASEEYDKLVQKNTDPQKRADLFHNLGNSQLMANDFEKSVESYKNSLRIRPDDEDTRYNLAYALQKLKEQQQQQQNDQDKNKQNKDQDKNKQDQENQDKQDKDKQDKEDQQQKQDEQKQEQQKQQQEQQQNVSKQEAEQMLNAVQNKEKEIKEKVDKEKAVASPVRTDKDW